MKQRIRAVVTTATLMALTASSSLAGDGVYQMKDGLLVVEFESANLVGDWRLETAVPGYTDAGFLRWDGPDYFGTPGNGVFGFDFHVPQGGTFDFRIRNHHDHPDSTEENDVWVRMDGGPWVKCFSPVANQWTWSTYHEFGGSKPPASYDLAAGQHRIEFSGRSHDFRIDRMHLFTPGHPKGTDPGQPESDQDQSTINRRPVAVARVTPGSVPAGTTSVVTLDGTGSYDPDDDALKYRWHVRGATFVDGTSPTSPVARVRLDDLGHANPVRLMVREDKGKGKGEESLSDVAYDVVNLNDSEARFSGDLVVWHTLEAAFVGPGTNEKQDDPNPFLDWRLIVTFRGPSGQEYDVHGFYDGDGEGTGAGPIWKARFTPDEGGVWTWQASFRTGKNVAIDQSPTAGTGTRFDGSQGAFAVLAREKGAPGFRSKGRLEYVGEHYMKFRDGSYFIKSGTDSPENFLGYAGFDDIQDNGNIGIVHEYAPHVGDWRPGDPEFVSNTTGVDSKGIIGALNYLGEQGVNSIYFLPMNLGGDGQETCPFVSYDSSDFAKTHYDVSRLHQWAQVLDHAQDQGIHLHVVLAETEPGNENWFDNGGFGVQRKLYFRELVARFGHSLALKWNLCEENNFGVQQLEDMASYISWLDPYDHGITVHTQLDSQYDYPYLLGNPHFTSTSIQYGPHNANQFVEQWRQKSAQAGQPWIIDLDENGTASEGVTDKNAEKMRKEALYDTYFSGGQIEWYAGYHGLPLGGDVRLENFRTREEMWTYTRHARTFLERLPFWEMKPIDNLLTAESSDWGGGQVFAKPGEVYAVYLPNAQNGGSLDLSNASGKFTQQWYDPRTGEFVGPRTLVQGGGVLNLGTPPGAPLDDWVVLVKKRK